MIDSELFFKYRTQNLGAKSFFCFAFPESIYVHCNDFIVKIDQSIIDIKQLHIYKPYLEGVFAKIQLLYAEPF